jgi:iron complex outermembrane recepter protein
MRALNTRRRRTIALTAAAAALLCAGGAWAQDTADSTVEELVVTAEKREMNLQEVPASVSAVSGETLQALGLTQLSDYTATIPGLNISSGGSPGQAAIVLRGIAPFGPGALVGTYIDDSPVGSSNAYTRAIVFALDLMPYDLERLEVLRGPQGTLYGASTMGGLLKYVLKPADPGQTDIRLGAELSHISDSDEASYGVRGAVNVPLIPGKLAVRASAFDSRDQGYIDNVLLTGPRAGVEENTNDVHRYGGRLALNWRPADTLSVQLQALWQRTDSDDNAQVTLGDVFTRSDPGGALIFDGRPIYGELAQSHAFLQPFRTSIDYYAATVNWDPGPVQLISATSWARSRTHQIQDAQQAFGAYTLLFGLPQGVGYFDLNLELDKFTQELRLVSETGGLVEWIVGAFYTHEDSVNEQTGFVFDENYQPIGGPLEPIFNPFFVAAALPSTYTEYAVFGDVTFNITEKFDVTAGVRLARNDQEFAQISDGLILGGFTRNEAESSEGVTTWMVNARYRLTPDVMVYWRVATGYRPGGPNVVLPPIQTPPTFGSDTLISYEAGLRARFWDGRALVNATLFHIDWENIILGVFNEERTASYTDNAGNAFSRGVELEGAITPIEGLRIGFNAAYTNAELTSVIPGAPNYIIGYQLPQVPEWSGGLSVDYQWALSPDWQANVGASVRHVGESWVGAVQDPSEGSLDTQNPSYTTLDLRAGLERDRYRLNLFVRNATDERVYREGFVRQNAVTGAIFGIDVVPIQPRVIGVSIDLDF